MEELRQFAPSAYAQCTVKVPKTTDAGLLHITAQTLSTHMSPFSPVFHTEVTVSIGPMD